MKKSNLILITLVVVAFGLLYWRAMAGGISGVSYPIDEPIEIPVEPIDDFVVIEEVPADDQFTQEWVLRQALKGGIDANTGSVTLQVDTMEDAWRIKKLFDNYYIGNYRVEWADRRIYLNDPALFITWRE